MGWLLHHNRRTDIEIAKIRVQTGSEGFTAFYRVGTRFSYLENIAAGA